MNKLKMNGSVRESGAGKGRQEQLQLWPPVLYTWLDFLISFDCGNPNLLTTHQRTYSRAHAGTPPACRNGLCLNFTAIE